MRSEIVWLTRLDASIDVTEIEKHLEALPWAWRDPVHGKSFFIAGTIRESRSALQERLDNPMMYPPSGVVVTVNKQRIAVSHGGFVQAMARAREFVSWLLDIGMWCAHWDWSATSSAPLCSATELYPDPLPDPSDLFDDAHESPVLVGTLTSWHASGRALSVHSYGPVRLRQYVSDTWIDGFLAWDQLERFNRAASFNPGKLGFMATNPKTRVVLARETPEGECIATFDNWRIPPAATPLSEEVTYLIFAMENWAPGNELPYGFSEISQVTMRE
jgi:hypothetical protein